MHTTSTIDYATVIDMARSIARSRGLSHADADDISQDVALRLLRHEGTLREDVTNLVWLATRQAIRDAWRSRSRRQEQPCEAAIGEIAVDRTPDTDTTDTAERLLSHAGHYRPAVERWARGDVLGTTDRKRVSRGLALIREVCVTD